MKIYHVDRVDCCDYDEYDGFVVLANNPEGALSIAIDRPDGCTKRIAGKWDLDHVFYLGEYMGEKQYDGGFILSSFNAG